MANIGSKWKRYICTWPGAPNHSYPESLLKTSKLSIYLYMYICFIPQCLVFLLFYFLLSTFCFGEYNFNKKKERKEEVCFNFAINHYLATKHSQWVQLLNVSSDSPLPFMVIVSVRHRILQMNELRATADALNNWKVKMNIHIKDSAHPAPTSYLTCKKRWHQYHYSSHMMCLKRVAKAHTMDVSYA